jgi:repressor of nif and glnA expression
MSTVADRLPPSADHDESDVVARPPLPADQLGELLAQHGDRLRPVLAALRDQGWRGLVSARDLIAALSAQGIDLAERTLRLHLSELAEAGLVERHGRRGYRLSTAGAEIARESSAPRRLGSILYRMEETTCQVSFDLASGQGLVSVNAYLVPRALLGALCDDLEAVFRARLAVGARVLLAAPGEDLHGRTVPDDHIGLGTMCSLTLAGMLMRHGVPSHPLFGGLLRVEGFKPAHFLEMARYDGTSLSPNELFIRAGFTSVARAATTGGGVITASFREVPMSALDRLRDLQRDCDEAVFPGLMLVGRPGQPVLNVPVHEGRVGVVMATGLNPIACLWERDHRVDLHAMVGPMSYDRLIPFSTFRHHALRLAR